MKKKRSIIQLFIIAMFFGAVLVRLFYLQVWNHVEIQKRVDRITKRDKPEDIQRGSIYDRNGRLLALSIKKYAVFVDPTCIEDFSAVVSAFKDAGVKLDVSLLKNKNGSAYVPIADDVDLEKVDILRSRKIKAIGYTPHFARQYPEGRLACHILGGVGKDKCGLEGVEYSANEYLSGKKVKNLRYRDGRGKEIPDKLLNGVQLKGADVFLTIDRNLQFIAEQEIESVFKESSAKRAMVIIQDPANGEILALACRPNYDPANFGDNWQYMRNPSISDMFEPGSTFKAITAAAALEEDIVKRKEVIWCEDGKYSIYGHVIKDHEKKGILTFDQVMEYSSNIGMAKIGQRLGKDKLYQYIRQFGFDSMTGIDLPGEARGLLKETSNWSGLSLPIISFGQEVGVTAIQMTNAYSAIFNGGNLLEPKVIKKIVDNNNETLYESSLRIIRRVASEKVTDDIKQMLIKVVTSGTGQLAQVPCYSVGGKTGTAQKRDPKTKRYSSSCYIASFCGAIPLQKPRLTIFVVIDEPKGDYYASSRAAPVFSKIASRAVRYLQISPDNDISGQKVDIANMGSRKSH